MPIPSSATITNRSGAQQRVSMGQVMTSCLGCDEIIPKGMRDSRCLPCQRVRDRAKNASSKPYRTKEWRALREDCLARDDGRCVVCAGTYLLTAHHLKGRKAGGPDVLWNLTTVCGSCHAHVERQLRHGISPECCPVLSILAEIQQRQLLDAGFRAPVPEPELSAYLT